VKNKNKKLLFFKEIILMDKLCPFISKIFF